MSQCDKDHPSVNHLLELYDTQVTAWLRLRPQHIHIEGPWLAKLIARVRPEGDILDLGCGTGGPIAEYFIQRGFNLLGVDGAPQMIAQCRQAFPDQQWMVAKMQTLCLDRQFDAILAWDSFFHLARHDQRSMFPVFARHARIGSRLLFNTGYNNGEAIGCFAGHDLYHASLDEQEYLSLLTDNGYRLLERCMPEPQSGQRAVWLAEKISEGKASDVECPTMP